MGIYIDQNGYERFDDEEYNDEDCDYDYIDDHSNLVHRRVAYHEIYKKNEDNYELPFGEYVVHHIDGNKRNNSVSNLLIMTPEDHETIHGISSPPDLKNIYYGSYDGYSSDSKGHIYSGSYGDYTSNFFSNFFAFHITGAIVTYLAIIILLFKLDGVLYFYDWQMIPVALIIYGLLFLWLIELIRQKINE